MDFCISNNLAWTITAEELAKKTFENYLLNRQSTAPVILQLSYMGTFLECIMHHRPWACPILGMPIYLPENVQRFLRGPLEYAVQL